jgi:hypothetical protein
MRDPGYNQEDSKRVYVDGVSASVLEKKKQDQSYRHRLNEVAVGADSTLQIGVAARAESDLGDQPPLTDAQVQKHQ